MTIKILEREARDILREYEGSNNQLLEWKNKLDDKSFKITRPQSDYVLTNQFIVPKVARKYVQIVDTFGEKLVEQKKLTKTPTKIWVEKLLCETDKAYHIWGRIFESERLSAMWIPKMAIVQEEKKLNRVIDFSKYDVRPPKDHQKVAIEKLLANDRFILADDMGLMKTGSSIIAALESGVKKILIVCPASLKINWQREIEIYSKRKTLIVEGGKWGSTFDFYIINYDILKNYHSIENENSRDNLIVNENFDLAIVDECFTYDTKVMTDNGEVYIGDIVENQLDVNVLSYNHSEKKLEYKKIVRWIRKNKDIIYRIKLNNGLFIECTDNHKFYVKNKGYVKARDITTNDDLFFLSETKENRSFKFVRMESFEILEQGSYDKSRNLLTKNTRVYDLEIEDNHNYFVNGILVSNCHYVSNTTSQRTQLLNDVLDKIPKVWLLTGTPITSRPINYYNLLKIVKSPLTLDWKGFVYRYCGGFQFTVRTGETPRKVWNTSGATNLDELRERTKNVVLRRLKTDILDLPEKIVTPIFLELESKFYNEEINEFLRISKENKEKDSISITLNRLMKVRQLIAIEKIPYTCEFIDKFIEQGKKVIVFTNFTMTLDMIREKYEKISVVLDGRMSQIKKQESVDKFQNNPKIKVFIANLKAGGVGHNLTAAEAVIMNDICFVPSDHSQGEDRAYRYGQKKGVMVYYPIFDNTIERNVYNILQRKKNIIDQVLGDGEYSESFAKELIKELL